MMDDIEEITAIVFPMGKLSEMELAEEVLKVFQRAERLVLICRELPTEEMDQGMVTIDRYVNRGLDKLERRGVINRETRDEQYSMGFLYLGHVGLTGKIP